MDFLIDGFPGVDWLVVSTPLKNMKVDGKDYPIYYGKIWKIKNVPNHQSVHTVDGRNPAPPGMVETLVIMG